MRPAFVCLLTVLSVIGLLSAVEPVAGQTGPDVPVGTLPGCLVPVEPTDSTPATTSWLGFVFNLPSRSLLLARVTLPSLSGGPMSPRARSTVLREPRREWLWAMRGSTARVVRR
jgi:hypothetical protein